MNIKQINNKFSHMFFKSILFRSHLLYARPLCFNNRILFDGINKLVKDTPMMIKHNYRTCGEKSRLGSGSGFGGKKINVSYKPYVAVVDLDHDHKNMVLGRPMSPHLDIYGPTLPAITSIIQRITGISLSFFALTMAVSELALPDGIHSLVKFIQDLDLPEFLIVGGKIIIAITFTYHYFIGIRFTMFNLGKLLDLKTAYQSAYLSILLAIGTGIACGLIGHLY